MRSHTSIILLSLISIALTNYYQEPTSASNQQHHLNNSVQAITTKKPETQKPAGNRGSGRINSPNKAL